MTAADEGGAPPSDRAEIAAQLVNDALRAPICVIVMGVSGTGKSTVAEAIALRLRWEFAEGDEFHPASNVAKMARGEPLTDLDRWPWLQSIGDWISATSATGKSSVVTCSALREVYRDLLREGRPEVVYCHMVADPTLIQDRMEHRPGHFMPPSLLPSQLATLEPLGEHEPGFVVLNVGELDVVVDRALDNLRAFIRANARWGGPAAAGEGVTQ